MSKEGGVPVVVEKWAGVAPRVGMLRGGRDGLGDRRVGWWGEEFTAKVLEQAGASRCVRQPAPPTAGAIQHGPDQLEAGALAG